MRTTVSISAPLLEAAKRRAADRGITLSELIEDVLRSQITEREQTPPPFRLRTVRGRLVDPSLDLDRSSALIALEDEADYFNRRA